MVRPDWGTIMLMLHEARVWEHSKHGRLRAKECRGSHIELTVLASNVHSFLWWSALRAGELPFRRAVGRNTGTNPLVG